MMRFSVMRTMVSVVVAFMVLGYPVIGQAVTCGKSINPIKPDPPIETVECPTKGTPRTEEKTAIKSATPKLVKAYEDFVKNNPDVLVCKEPCSGKCFNEARGCNILEKSKKIDPKDKKVFCKLTVAKKDDDKDKKDIDKEKCDDKQQSRYVCSVNLEVTCGCKCGPDLVNLDEFTATPQNDGISLTWTTKSELDSQGFRIWRGTPDLGKYCGCSDNMDDYKQITMTTLDEKGNPTLIPATGNTTSGSNYAYLDKEVKPGIPYCYVLEDIDSNGESKFYYEYITFTPDAELEQSTQ